MPAMATGGQRHCTLTISAAGRRCDRWSSCESAEQLGKKLRRRYQRQQQRRGIAPAGRGHDDGELADQLDSLLAQD
jgi:hypothetical protein